VTGPCNGFPYLFSVLCFAYVFIIFSQFIFISFRLFLLH
jgi:hypothetical protein